MALKAIKKDSELTSRNLEKQIVIHKAEVVKLNEYKILHQEEVKKQKKVEKKMKQKERKNTKSEYEIVKPAQNKDKAILENSDETKDLFKKIRKEPPLCESNNKVTVENEEDGKVQSLTVTNSKNFPDHNLISRDFNQNKPPGIQAAASQSEPRDNLMEMNAEEFSKLLFDCITNFRAKQSSN